MNKNNNSSFITLYVQEVATYIFASKTNFSFGKYKITRTPTYFTFWQFMDFIWSSLSHLWLDGSTAELSPLLFRRWHYPLLLLLLPPAPLILLFCPSLALHGGSLRCGWLRFTWVEGITFHWASWWGSTFPGVIFMYIHRFGSCWKRIPGCIWIVTTFFWLCFRELFVLGSYRMSVLASEAQRYLDFKILQTTQLQHFKGTNNNNNKVEPTWMTANDWNNNSNNNNDNNYNKVEPTWMSAKDWDLFLCSPPLLRVRDRGSTYLIIIGQTMFHTNKNNVNIAKKSLSRQKLARKHYQDKNWDEKSGKIVTKKLRRLWSQTSEVSPLLPSRRPGWQRNRVSTCRQLFCHTGSQVSIVKDRLPFILKCSCVRQNSNQHE